MTVINIDLEYIKGEQKVAFSRYHTDPDVIAVMLYGVDDFEQEIVTVNLAEYGIIPEPGNVIIKDYSEMQGMADALLEAGVVTEIVTRHSFGFVQNGGAECVLNPKHLTD